MADGGWHSEKRYLEGEMRWREAEAGSEMTRRAIPTNYYGFPMTDSNQQQHSRAPRSVLFIQRYLMRR